MTGIRLFSAGCLLLVLCLGVTTAWADQPNIILILADDMGCGDCTVYNPESKISTPHIDQPAKQGLRSTDAHAAASTRSMILKQIAAKRLTSRRGIQLK